MYGAAGKSEGFDDRDGWRNDQNPHGCILESVRPDAAHRQTGQRGRQDAGFFCSGIAGDPGGPFFLLPGEAGFRGFLAFIVITCIVNSINCIWVAVAAKFVPDWVYNIGTTVLNGGVSMVIFFFVNKIIFPEGEAKA